MINAKVGTNIQPERQKTSWSVLSGNHELYHQEWFGLFESISICRDGKVCPSQSDSVSSEPGLASFYSNIFWFIM